MFLGSETGELTREYDEREVDGAVMILTTIE